MFSQFTTFQLSNSHASSSKVIVVGTTNCFCLPCSFISHIPLRAKETKPQIKQTKTTPVLKKSSILFDKSGENVTLASRWQASSSKAIVVVVGTTNCFCLPRSFISHIPLSAQTPDQTNKKQPPHMKKVFNVV